jgi:predicted Zn-dependent protease
MFLWIGFGSNRLKKRKSQAGKGGKQIFHPSLQLRDTPRLRGYIANRY